MTEVRFYSNWEIMLAVLRRPIVHWRHYRDGNRVFNGWWFRNPYAK